MQWTKSREELAKLLRDLPAYLSGKIADPTGIIPKMYREMGRVALEIVHEAFKDKAIDRSADASGNYWQDVTEYTISHSRNKARRSQSPEEAEPLIDQGRLFKSLDPDAPTGDTVLRVTDNGCQGGTAVPYADRHQKGQESSRLGIPVPIRMIIPQWDQWPPEWKARVMTPMIDGVGQFLEAVGAL